MEITPGINKYLHVTVEYCKLRGRLPFEMPFHDDDDHDDDVYDDDDDDTETMD